MASGSFYITRTGGSSYLSFRVDWSSASNGTAANSSSVTVWVYVIKAGSSSSSTSGTANTTVDINGWSQSENGLRFNVSPGGTTLLFAKNYQSIGHNADGSKSINISVSVGGNIMSASGNSWVALDSIPRQANLTGAPDFNDTQSPTITYSNPAGSAVTLQACISFTGARDDIPYRTIDANASSYTFNLSQAELNALYGNTTSSNSCYVIFHLKTIIGGTSYFSTIGRYFTIADPNPTLEPTVVDQGEGSTELTGDSNKIIKYYNSILATFNATAKKGATISSMNVTCGDKSRTSDGVLENVTSGEFVFTVTDSRGNTATKTITKTADEIVEYVPLRSYFILTPSFSGGETATIRVGTSTVSFVGSFGAITNTVTYQYRYKVDDGEYPTDSNGNEIWTDLTTSTYVLRDLDYTSTYTFQGRVKDEVTSRTVGWVDIAEQVCKVVPVFDWGKNDFNFNVPVHSKGGLTEDIRTLVSVDCNSIRTSGRYYIGSGGTNKPGTGVDGWLTVQSYGSNYCYQEYVTNAGEKYYRMQNEDGLGSWLLNDTIIEYGNSNGWYYAKYSFGKCELWGTVNTTYANPHVCGGTVFYPFIIYDPVCIATLREGSNASEVLTRNVKVDFDIHHCNLWVHGSAGTFTSAYVLPVTVHVIGHWK